MLKKEECETAIRHLCSEWANSKGFTPSSDYHAHFSEFTSWMSSNGYSRYLNFRSKVGAVYDAEVWFDEEMKQTWQR